MSIMPGFEAPATRGAILFPGLPVLPPGVERHPVPGGGSRAVPIEAGDEITLVDREGLQPCEVVFFGRDGRSDAGMLGAKSAGAPAGLQSILGGEETSARRVRKALADGGFDLAQAEAIRFFESDSRPGDSETVMAKIGRAHV